MFFDWGAHGHVVQLESHFEVEDEIKVEIEYGFDIGTSQESLGLLVS